MIDHWHPFAERFPRIEGAEWEAFKASIAKTKGNRVPVTYRMVGGKAEGLDGRNRLLACEELGIPCRMEEEIVPDAEVKDYILARNVHRRHLSAELRRELVAELRQDGKSERSIAESLGVSKATVHRDLGPGGSNEPPGAANGKVTGKDGKSYPSRAERVGQKPPTPFVPKEREPGDDTEQIAADKAKGKQLPKPGAVLFDWSPFEAAYGALVRQVDTLGKAYRAKESADAGGLRKMLKEFHASFKAWHKELTGGRK